MGYLKDRMSEDLRKYGLRPVTRGQYLGYVESYARHFNRSPAKLGAGDIEAYLDHLEKKEKRPAGFRQLAILALKFFYFVTLDRPEVAACFLSPGKREPAPAPLSRSDLDRLISSVAPPLHRTVLTVALGGGLRLCEACRLRAGDIDGKRMLIRLDSPNSAWPQFVPLHPETLATLRRWWRDTRPRTDLLFTVDRNGNPPTPGRAQKALRRAASAGGFDCATIEKRLRYSFFAHRLGAAAHPREVMHLLRCTSIRPAPGSFITQKKATSFNACEAVKGGRI